MYTSLTIRLDVKTWLREKYEIHKDEYALKYKLRNFTQFAGIFMINMFESKTDQIFNKIKRIRFSMA